MTQYIWENRKEYIENFEYDNEFGIAVFLDDTLSSEAVDAMQSMWSKVIGLNIYGKPHKYKFKTKREFRSAYKRRLRELGELVR